MSGIGFWELIVLFLIGLIVLGPERLPRVANQVGNWLGQARRMTRVMKRQLEDELDLNKQPTIRPPASARTPSFKSSVDKPATGDAAQPADPAADPGYVTPRDDDDYSPAHAADDVGTGISEDIGEENAEADVPDQAQAAAVDVDKAAETRADEKKAS